VNLLGEGRKSEKNVSFAIERHGEESLTRLRRALASLRDAHTVRSIFECLPQAVASLGFDRVLISEMGAGNWVPRYAHFDGNQEWAATLIRMGLRSPIPLDVATPEARMVSSRCAILVTRDSGMDTANREALKASHTRAYVAAPLTLRGETIGIVHADHYMRGRVPTESDRSLLWAFCEATRFALESAKVSECLQSIAMNAQWILEGSQGQWAPLSLAVRPSKNRPRRSGSDADLNERETRIMQAMSAGLTNLEIARLLLLSEGTVKACVRLVLRKLGARNRAEAVSRWREFGI